MALKNTLSSRTNDASDTWLTPQWILTALTKDLGDFDLDPATPPTQPWPTAKKTYALDGRGEDGLVLPWDGASVFCNPPYGQLAYHFLDRCAEHGNAVALIFARTETKGFQAEVFDKSDAILFIKGRLKFAQADGSLLHTATAPSCLVAYGAEAVSRLKNSDIPGKLIFL